MSAEIKALECKFAIHIPSRNKTDPDVHMIKETRHMSDGSLVPAIRFIKDFKRSIYITHPSKRNHKDKKEWEHVDNLIEKQVTQSNIKFEICKLLNKPWSNDSLRQLSASPYLYGTDITSTALIKHGYQAKYPDALTNFTVATYDIETDVTNGTEDPILATIAFKDKIFTAVLGSWVSGFSCIDDRIQKAANKYIGEYIEKYNLKIELYVAKDVLDMFKAVFSKAHEWKPDFLAIWNMDFDIPKTMAAIEKYGGRSEDVFCDPAVPKQLRICKYKQGSKKKVTASGKVIPINPPMQWHTLLCTSSFYVIDAMCSYKQIRSQKQEEPSYALDAILNKELGIRKLKFVEADAYSGLKWHQVMQSEFKIEYIIYNMFDCLSMLELDAKTKDLCSTLPVFAGVSDFNIFKSQPKRIADALYFFCKNKGFILSTVPPSKTTEEESEVEESEDTEENEAEEELKTLDLKNWIVTLPAHMMTYGIKCVEDDESLHSNIRAFAYDSDSVSAYPTCITVSNVSKDTTHTELISIDGITEDTFRVQNMNLVIGNTNAINYVTEMFNMPKPYDLLKFF